MSAGTRNLKAKEEYSLSELAESTGIQARTIRSYIEQKIISGPASRGRYARYDRRHLSRLLAIRELLDRDIRLADIRVMLATMTEPELEDLAGLTHYSADRQPFAVSDAVGGTALQYLEGLRGGRSSTSVETSDSEVPDPQSGGDSSDAITHPGPAASASRSDPAYTENQDLSRRPRSTGKRAKREPWYEIEITPDVRLEVRGGFDERQLRHLEHLADDFRQKLLGGIDE